MGALIHTPGTRRLAAHYNDEFDTFIQVYRDNAAWFDTTAHGGVKLWQLVDNAQDANDPGHSDRGDGKILLPAPKSKHKNLEKRWKWYLKSFLDQATNDKLCNAIHAALIKATPGGAYVYSGIVFDVVEDVAFDVKATDMTIEPGGPLYRSIVLYTKAMPSEPQTQNGDDPDPIDKTGKKLRPARLKK